MADMALTRMNNPIGKNFSITIKHCFQLRPYKIPSISTMFSLSFGIANVKNLKNAFTHQFSCSEIGLSIHKILIQFSKA